MKTISLKQNSDFKRLYYRGQSIVKKRIVIYLRKNKFSYNRMGITVSPKVGCAVVRNRVRRLIKENYRLIPNKKYGYDLVVVARRCAAFSDYYGIKKDLESALYDGGLIKRDESD